MSHMGRGRIQKGIKRGGAVIFTRLFLFKFKISAKITSYIIANCAAIERRLAMAYIQLDSGTMYEIRRMSVEDSMPVEEIAEYFGIPESLVQKVLLNRN